MRLSDVVSDQEGEYIIQQTDWIEDGDDREKLHHQFTKLFDEAAKVLEANCGPPVEFCNDGAGRLENHNHGLIRWAIFDFEGQRYLLGYGQHDAETPIFLSSEKLKT